MDLPTLGNCVLVEMEDPGRCVTAPDWLVTRGVSSCIAVVVMSDCKKKAWLIHSHTFGHDAAALKGMLSDAAGTTKGADLRVQVFGGVPAGAGCAEEADLARRAVTGTVETLLPKAAASYDWSEVSELQVLAEAQEWRTEVRR